MIDQYFAHTQHRTDLSFNFFFISESKKIDSTLVDNLKENILKSYRSIDQYKFHVKGFSDEEIKKYVLDYVIPKNKTTIDANVRQGDWGEILAGLMVSKFQDLSIPINKLRWKFNKDKSVFGTDLIAFNQGPAITDIYYYEIKTRLNPHKKEGKKPNYNYISVLAHNSLLKDENSPNEMIAEFLMRYFVDRGEYDTAQKFSDIVKNPTKYNRNFELFFIVEKSKYNEVIFEELNTVTPLLAPLCVTVIIIDDLQQLVHDTWLGIEDHLATLIKS